MSCSSSRIRLRTRRVHLAPLPSTGSPRSFGKQPKTGANTNAKLCISRALTAMNKSWSLSNFFFRSAHFLVRFFVTGSGCPFRRPAPVAKASWLKHERTELAEHGVTAPSANSASLLKASQSTSQRFATTRKAVKGFPPKRAGIFFSLSHPSPD